MHSFNIVYVSCRSKSGNGRGSLAYVVSTSDEKSESSNGGSEKSDDKVKDSIDIEKSGSTSSNGGRVTRSSQRAAATAAHSTPTSGQNSANQSPTSSPTQNPTNQAPSPGMIEYSLSPCTISVPVLSNWGVIIIRSR